MGKPLVHALLQLLARVPVQQWQAPVKRSTGHAHTHTHIHRQRNNTPDTDTHTHTMRTTPQTNTSHKHFMLEGGETTVRATSHARVGGRAEVSVRGSVEVRRGLGRARIRHAPASACEQTHPASPAASEKRNPTQNAESTEAGEELKP